MKDLIFELYEDNAGGLHIFGFAGQDCVPVYCSDYTPAGAYDASQEWATILGQGFDCDWTSDRDPAAAWDELEAKQIGSTVWEDPMGVDLDRCCLAGKEIACYLGAAYECPECGHVQAAVRNVLYPDSWTNPDRCEACGAIFED